MISRETETKQRQGQGSRECGCPHSHNSSWSPLCRPLPCLQPIFVSIILGIGKKAGGGEGCCFSSNTKYLARMKNKSLDTLYISIRFKTRLSSHRGFGNLRPVSRQNFQEMETKTKSFLMPYK